ncbi:hypothetical protein [Flavobacterium sp.]|uniref:hypothetical protein n=1 Tax=Flavobacterium sp. TaxID=239 RepID=UPI0025FD3BB2|nr:hypothetical protein [Flavobacterium sp.]
MEPNKLEKQFRDQLNAREIQPSAQAWDRLDAMLSVAEEKKSRKPFGFLFIAASILVVVTLGMFFFNQSDTVISMPNTTVVGAETKNDTVQNPAEINAASIVESQKQDEVVASVNNQPTTNNQQPVTNHQGVSIQNQSVQSNQILRNKEIEYQITSDVALKDLPEIVAPKENVIRKDFKIKSDDSLLANLDQSVKESTNKKSSVKVDAKSLLSQVDGEVEYSFREKMLQKINKNYQEVKVALANRNNE